MCHIIFGGIFLNKIFLSKLHYQTSFRTDLCIDKHNHECERQRRKICSLTREEDNHTMVYCVHGIYSNCMQFMLSLKWVLDFQVQC